MFMRLNETSYKFDYRLSLVQIFMRKGYRFKAHKIINLFFATLKKEFRKRKINETVSNLLNETFDKYAPAISIKKKKVAANVYHLPWIISRHRAKSMFVHWFIKSALERSELKTNEKLVKEFFDLYMGVGRTVRKVEDLYKLAMDNRPFFRYLRRQRKSYIGRIKKFGVKLRRRR